MISKVKPHGFDYPWFDETEPDIDPAKDLFFVGSGSRYYNIYPLFHTASVFEGFRRDFGDTRRLMILARRVSRSTTQLTISCWSFARLRQSLSGR